ncbi:hypothetical protein HHI36_013507, partial [Cryptolaemus montrouzieri]
SEEMMPPNKTLMSRLKSAINSSIRPGHCEQIANASNESKEIWKIINAEVKEPKRVNVNSNLSTHTLCDHFANVSMRYKPENPDQNESPQSYAKKTATSDYNSMMLTDTTAIEIMTLVHGMKEKNSVDIYDFSVTLLKKIIHLSV